MAGARGLAEKHQPQRTPRTAIKKTNPHLTLSPTMTSFFPVPARSVKGSLFPNSVPSAFSWLVKSLSACLPFALNSSENALNLPFLDAFLEIGSLVCGDFAFANPEGDFNTPFLPVHLQGDERAASLFCCTG
jgi:hypothetical protein